MHQIRGDERLAKIRVMVVTADSRKGDELRNIADVVLIKPISFRQVMHLAQLIGKV